MLQRNIFPFLDLPPEIRNEVYYFGLGERHDPSDPYGPSTCAALAAPAITRANRQLRRETLPFYYSQNRFVVHLPLFFYPGDDGVDQPAFERWCAAMAPHFRFLTHSFSFVNQQSYRPLKFPTPTAVGLPQYTYKFCVTLYPSSSYPGDEDEEQQHQEGWRRRQRRIGGETLDTSDKSAVDKACLVAMRAQTNPHFWIMGRKQPFADVAKALSAVAPLCTQINSRMYFSWDVPDYHKPRRPQYMLLPFVSGNGR